MKYIKRIIAVIILVSVSMANGQGTIEFNGRIYAGLYYSEQGMEFNVIVPTYGPGDGVLVPNHDIMGITAGDGNPFLLFFQQSSPDNYVSFNLVSGGLFGLSSVQLADPLYPSSVNLPITFMGTKSDNTIVTETFTIIPDRTRNFQSFTFDSDFAYGLKSVDILAPRWAMDNLVFIPEPSTTALIGFGLLAGWRTLRKRRLL